MQEMTSPSVSKNRNGLGSMLQVNLQQAYNDDMMKNSNDESSNSNSSPYYKGLTDQSLAIFAPSSPPHHATIPCYPITPLPHLSSSGSGAQGQSPYYKGLTDYSLVIGSWSSHNPTSTNPSYHPQSSPYYRGLTDFSLVLHDHPQETAIDPNDLVLIQEGIIDATDEEEKPLRERVTVTPDDDDLQDTRTNEDIYHHHQEITSLQEDPNAYQYEWATKHQPQTLEEFICNSDKALQLQALVREGCGCNHFIFEGPPNVGKRSMIRAMLRDLFGPQRLQGEMVDKLQVQIKKSLHHVEINVSETKGYEKHVIVDLFNGTYAKTINNSLPCSPDNCQAVIRVVCERMRIVSCTIFNEGRIFTVLLLGSFKYLSPFSYFFFVSPFPLCYWHPFLLFEPFLIPSNSLRWNLVFSLKNLKRLDASEKLLCCSYHFVIFLQLSSRKE
ncbi:hypothetical protein HN51_046979, partial [Arachis hypogaea]